MTTILIYAGAALAEIVGCFAVWALMRQGASVLWLAPGLVNSCHFCLAPDPCLPQILQGGLMRHMEASVSRRRSFGFGPLQKQRPDVWDVTGGAICPLVRQSSYLFQGQSDQ